MIMESIMMVNGLKVSGIRNTISNWVFSQVNAMAEESTCMRMVLNMLVTGKMTGYKVKEPAGTQMATSECK